MNTQEKIKSMKKYKITLTEFWKSKKLIGIHCDTEEKAKELLKAFDKLGKTWHSKTSYLEDTNWDFYEYYTCYMNNGMYSCTGWLKNKNHNMYEFEDVDLNN